MPWFLEPVPVTSGIDWLVALLRMAIADPKTTVNQVVREENDEVSSGLPNEVFYTDQLPISSGCTTYMRIDRWLYTEKNEPTNRTSPQNIPSIHRTSTPSQRSALVKARILSAGILRGE